MANQYTNPWTEEQDNIIYDMIETQTIDAIAKKLNRSPKAVTHRVERLGIDRHIISGTISALELSQILGVDIRTIIRWIQHKGLPAKQRGKRRGEKRKHKSYYILPEKFWIWANEHRKSINFAKIERGVLIPEPDWLNEQAKKDYYNPNKIRRAWTEEEDKKVWSMYYQGKTQKEIATEMQRTLGSVEKRLKRLRQKKIKEVMS